MKETHEGHHLICTDINHYAFCPRFLFYERCLSGIRPRTSMMDIGKEEHEEEEFRAKRRTLTAYELTEGIREFRVHLKSERHHLVGILDEWVKTPTGALYPVEYKFSNAVHDPHRLQLAAYGLLIQEQFGVSVPHGFIYLIPKKKTVKVPLGEARYAELERIIGQIWEIIEKERMPPPTPDRPKCVSCEFRRFCNDV
ncbi:MAG: CRISPR-associated protein Cas4 [bacterium]|nr:CRISPR-associated protein Cas4 [bacterium]